MFWDTVRQVLLQWDAQVLHGCIGSSSMSSLGLLVKPQPNQPVIYIHLPKEHLLARIVKVGMPDGEGLENKMPHVITLVDMLR